MAARRPYRMTPARKAAIRKAQIASARKRKGSGKGKPVSMRRRAAQAPSGVVRRRAAAPKTTTKRTKTAQASNRKRNLRRIAVASAAVAAAGGAAYTYKNREKLIIAPAAERKAIKLSEARLGRKLTKSEKQQTRALEKKLHAQRSTFRAREYLIARSLYQQVSKASKGKTHIRPALFDPEKSAYSTGTTKTGHNAQLGHYTAYQKDRFVRAEKRLQKLHRQKKTALASKGLAHDVKQAARLKRRGYIFARNTKGFDYKSGKQLKFRRNNIQGVYRSWF